MAQLEAMYALPLVTDALAFGRLLLALTVSSELLPHYVHQLARGNW
jgi:hypothetical protein